VTLPSSLARQVQSALNTLDDAERHLRNGDPDRAKREVQDAISALRGLPSKIKRLVEPE
jgi:hypothetical protein